MATPASITRWLSSVYPTLHLRDDWLSDCCTYISTEFPTLTPPAFIKKVEEQILLSSLDEICERGSLPSADLSETLQCVIGGGAKAAILVQITSMTEVGASANSLREVHETRKEEQRITDKGGQAERTRVIGNTEDEEIVKGKVKFARSMLQFMVSDGFTALKAIEYKRIPELSLEDTPLGCKLLLKEVKTLRGIMLLTPACVSIKGMLIPELNETKNAVLEAALFQRLGIEPAEEENATTQGPVQPALPLLPPVIQNDPAHRKHYLEEDDHADLLKDIDFKHPDESLEIDEFDDDFLRGVEEAEMALTGSPPVGRAKEEDDLEAEEQREVEERPKKKIKKEVIDLSLSSDE